jgi:hypothetical protein
MIRVRLLPAADIDFQSRVREALRQIAPHHDPSDGSAIVAPSEADLRRALSYVRARYPDVWIRRQDPLASVDGMETWYAFRDEATTRPDERVGAARR